MPRSERGLLAVSALALGGAPALRRLYRLLDAAAAWLARRLGRVYGSSEVLRGSEATLAGVAAAVHRLAAGGHVGALDVFLNVHGQARTVTLSDGEVPLASVAAALAAGAANGARPRLVYSTACHAAAHAAVLRASGFRACVGARCINATGAVETPLFFALWARGVSLQRALRFADHPAVRRPTDAIARVVLRAVGERGAVDSGKELSGAGRMTIESAP